MASKGKPVGKSISTSALSSLSTAKASTLPPSGSKLSVVPAKSTGAGLSVFKSNEMTVAADKRKKEEQEGQIVEAVEKFSAESEWEQRDTVMKYLQKTEELNYLILARAAKEQGFTSTPGAYILNIMKTNVENGLESGVLLLQALLKSHQRLVEPYAVPLLPKLMGLQADKSATVRDVSMECAKLLCGFLCPESFRIVYPMLDAAMQNENWKIKVIALNLLQILAPRMSQQLSPLLPELIPRVSDCMHDSKKQVQTAALDAMNEACRAITNDDIRPIVPQLVSVIAHPEESIATLDLLLETTFVATVDASVLALIAPLLGKSLRNRSSVMKRKASRVIDIMCRLVQNPYDVAPFKDMLLPALEKVIDELVDAEVCEVATAARDVLLRALGEGKALVEQAPPLYTVPQVQAELLKALEAVLPTGCNVGHITTVYAAQMCAHLMIYDAPAPVLTAESEPLSGTWRDLVANTPKAQWKDCCVPYFTALLVGKKASSSTAEAVRAPALEEKSGPEGDAECVEVTDGVERLKLKPRSGSVGEVPSAASATASERAEKLASLFRTAALGGVKDRQTEVDDEGTDLCNIEFSLAFGGKILLHNTFLKLGKGRRYGVMGKNGAGKTTLLTNIGTGNIEGLPTTMKTVYVQHDDASDDHGVPLIDELLAHKDLADVKVTREEAVDALKAIKFTEEMITSPRSCLSGGWKMKLVIIKAMLSKADVLLLDEPTNHLDAASVQWLVDYLLAQPQLTCLIVSHDTAFMDKVLTDVIHYENKKLVYYHGNLTHFVKVHPEARYYHELEGSTLSFRFPVPGRLDGINSNTRAVLKLENVNYTYPGAAKPTLTNVNVKVCLGSRIAVVGANGAGKSTMIRMLVQETKPDEGVGSFWKHINLRIAYVAQHSLHHVEQHLDSSPVDYIKWRFYGGVDREDMARPDKKLTEEEEFVRSTGEKKYGDVEEVVGRRKYGRTMEYECTFVGQVHGREPNKYIALEKMIEMGLQKLVQQCDAKTAAMAAGLDVRPLLTAEIQNHLNDFNLEAEFGTHSTIKRLSGGQKVKLVLAAAMWNKPHIIVLDEPTNYLDREALGALTQAIKNFAGGVVIISHNKEFTDAICTEEWLVKDGQCFTQGGVEETGEKVKVSKVKKSSSAPNLENAGTDDAAGNLNKTISSDIILNPKTLEALSKKQYRQLERCAQVAGVSMKDYVQKITCKSPEWKWL